MKKLLAFRNDWAGRGELGQDLIGGPSYYRITKPVQFLRRKYNVFEFGDLVACQANLARVGKNWEIDEIIPNLIRDSDIVLMKNVSHPGGLGMFAGAAEYYNKPLILDMDDDYLSVDPEHPWGEYFASNTVQQLTHNELFKASTAMIVSTEPLVDVYKPYNQNIHVIHNYNDVEDWQFERRKHKSKIVIGWAGSSMHKHDLGEFRPVMDILWEKYGDKILFAFCGAWTDDHLKGFPRKAYRTFSGTKDMRDYPAALAGWGFDIGVAPIVKSAFNDGKGHGKWMEYSMYKTPTVASNFGPYKRTMEDGVTGLLAETTDEWVDKISRLVDDAALRQQIGQTAYDHVKANWQWADHYQEWEKVFSQYQTFR